MFRVTEKPDSASIEYTQAPMASLMGVLQIFCALFFSSYFFFWALGLCGLIMSVQLNIISLRAACYLSAAYVTSIFVYKPQNTRGWYFHWFLYGPLTDLVLGYYGSRCIREGPRLDPKQGYLFAMAPHGVFGVCRAFSGGQLWRRLFPQIDARWGSFGGAFYIPGVREFSLCCGCLDASRPVLTRAIARGENVMLLPGGEKEMMLTDGASSQTQLVLLDRKGFVRLAIQHGLALVPGFCFGEKWVHDTVLLPKRVRAFLYKRFRLAGVLLKGRWWTFLGKLHWERDGVPVRLGFVWGKPIPVRQTADLSTPAAEAYVDQVHAQFMGAVADLFSRHKEQFGYGPEETLAFVSASDTYGHQ